MRMTNKLCAVATGGAFFRVSFDRKFYGHIITLIVMKVRAYKLKLTMAMGITREISFGPEASMIMSKEFMRYKILGEIRGAWKP